MAPVHTVPRRSERLNTVLPLPRGMRKSQGPGEDPGNVYKSQHASARTAADAADSLTDLRDLANMNYRNSLTVRRNARVCARRGALAREHPTHGILKGPPSD